jgi:hypothetical protein
MLRFIPDGFASVRKPASVGTQPDSFLAVRHGNDIGDPVHAWRARGRQSD